MPRLHITLCFISTSCLSQRKLQKDNPQPAKSTLPPTTQNGSQTISFRVSGKGWLPEDRFSVPYWAYLSPQNRIDATRIGGTASNQCAIASSPLQFSPANCGWIEQGGVAAFYRLPTSERRVGNGGRALQDVTAEQGSARRAGHV